MSLEGLVDHNSIRADHPFDHASSERRDDAQDQEPECFYCLSGWVFLGSLDHDGQDIFDAVPCRKCSGTGRISS